VYIRNAERLIAALGNEGERWTEKLVELEESVKYLHGTSILSAACLAYIGPCLNWN
jgi:hypothetical protein